MQCKTRDFVASLMGATLLLAPLAHAAAFSLTSPDIKAGGKIPKNFEFNGFGCAGEIKSPALKWS